MSEVSVEALSVDKEQEVKPYLAKTNTHLPLQQEGPQNIWDYKKLTVQT